MIEIGRKELLGAVLLILLAIATGFAASNTGVISFAPGAPNPGHEASGVGPGTFKGDATDVYSFPGTVAAAALDVSGTIDAPGFTESGNTTLSNDISGNAATANTASDLSCTDCIGATEIGDGLGINEIDETEIQIKVSGDCAGRVVTGINADGSVSCEDDDSGGTDTDWTVSGNDIYSGVSGNVGIGDPTPEAKLTVSGSIEIADTAAACNAAHAGAIKFDGSDFFGCNGSSWNSLTSGGGDSTGDDLINGSHNENECTSAGGIVINDGSGNLMCKFGGSSCPGGWNQYQNWTTTIPASSSYTNEINISNCQQSSPCSTQTAICTTSSHGWANTARESRTCAGAQATYQYYGGTTDNDGNPTCEATGSCSGATNVTIQATITEIGCY